VNKAPEAFRTISEVADELDLPQHVLRFWETRFSQIKPMKRGGGRRYYRPDDVDLLRGIRHLLYGEGYTIRGVQRILKDHGPRFVQTVWQAGAPQPAQAPGDIEHEAAAPADSPVERGRGLFRLLPSLLAREGAGDIGQARRRPAIGEASIAPVEPDEIIARTVPHSAAPEAALVASVGSAVAGAMAAPSGLARAQIEKLEATLAELAECRRLIDLVLTENC
jgi:DNA-binding transcriptional MerR regulator